MKTILTIAYIVLYSLALVTLLSFVRLAIILYNGSIAGISTVREQAVAAVMLFGISSIATMIAAAIVSVTRGDDIY